MRRQIRKGRGLERLIKNKETQIYAMEGNDKIKTNPNEKKKYEDKLHEQKKLEKDHNLVYYILIVGLPVLTTCRYCLLLVLCVLLLV